MFSLLLLLLGTIVLPLTIIIGGAYLLHFVLGWIISAIIAAIGIWMWLGIQASTGCGGGDCDCWWCPAWMFIPPSEREEARRENEKEAKKHGRIIK